MKIVIDDIEYREAPQAIGDYGCDGCVACNDTELCKQLPLSCYPSQPPIIFVRNETV